MAEPYVAEASAVTKASPAQAASVILSPESLPKWFKGAHSAVAEAGFPDVGGRLRWKVRWLGMSSDFGGTVVRNDLPSRLVMRVKTPSGESDIIHSFTKDGKGTRYTKRVEVQDAGPVLRLLLASFLRRSVRDEVAAGARVADEAVEGR